MLIVLSGSGQNTNGNLYELDAIAAAIIGGTLLSGGRGTIIGSVLGVLVFTTITNIFALNNLQSDVQQIAKGAIIVAAVLVQRRTLATARPDPSTSPTSHPHPQPTHRRRVTAMPETSRRGLLFGTAAVSAGALLTACTSNEPKDAGDRRQQPAAPPTTSPARHVTIGFAGPQADHGWLNAINEQRQVARQEVLRRHAGDHRGLQRHRRADRPDRDPHQQEGRRPGHPARRRQGAHPGRPEGDAGRASPSSTWTAIFASPQAYRCWIGGDNYGMGLNAGHYIGEQLKDKTNAKVIELAGHRQPGADPAAHARASTTP